jgi:hypothetical protein
LIVDPTLYLVKGFGEEKPKEGRLPNHPCGADSGDSYGVWQSSEYLIAIHFPADPYPVAKAAMFGIYLVTMVAEAF